jgi:hypothetical protein
MEQHSPTNNMKNINEIEDIITKAIKKVGGRKENDLCRFIPMTTGGYMHHFTLKKLKNRAPEQLGTLIEKFIINTDRPSSVTPKSRAARGSRKKRDNLQFSRPQLERMLTIARQAGDKEMIAILAPKKSLASCKKELVSSIRHNRIEPELWNAYVECMNSINNPQTTELASV